ncbi:MAG: hypothetical protein ACK49D_01010 [Flavobacteriia bacterium]|jgi:hypothetical protein
MKTATILLFLSSFFAQFSYAQKELKSEIINQNSMPLTDFPKLTSTGNPLEDALNYSNAKEIWVAANPRAYEIMLTAESVDMLPGFPQKERTGNTDLDDLNFKQAKDIWYQTYPEILKFFYENNSKKYSNVR